MCPQNEKAKANAITVGDHTVTNTNVKNAQRCPAANAGRKSKQANHPTALARTMKVRIGPHSEDAPRSSFTEPCNEDSERIFGWAASVLPDELSISFAVLVAIDILPVCRRTTLVDRCSAANPCAFPANGYAPEPQGAWAVSRRDWETKPVLELLAVPFA